MPLENDDFFVTPCLRALFFDKALLSMEGSIGGFDKALLSMEGSIGGLFLLVKRYYASKNRGWRCGWKREMDRWPLF